MLTIEQEWSFTYAWISFENVPYNILVVLSTTYWWIEIAKTIFMAQVHAYLWSHQVWWPLSLRNKFRGQCSKEDESGKWVAHMTSVLFKDWQGQTSKFAEILPTQLHSFSETIWKNDHIVMVIFGTKVDDALHSASFLPGIKGLCTGVRIDTRLNNFDTKKLAR